MKEDIKVGIKSLHYDPKTVLAFNGNAVENVDLTEDMVKNGEYVVVTRKTVNANNKDFEIEVVNASNCVAYPGALLLANEDLVNGTPQGLFYAQRAPITLSIDLPGMPGGSSIGVGNVCHSEVTNAINTLTSRWLDNHENYHQAANYSYSETKAYSKDQLRVKAGFDLADKLNLNFTNVEKAEKQLFILSFKQIFYTVSLDIPKNPEDFFTEDETWKNIVEKNKVDDKNPPVFVSSVAYGRIVYVALETSNMSHEIESKIKAAISNAKLNADVFKESIFNESQYTTFVLGGDAKTHTGIVTKDFGKIEEIITGNSLFTKENPGVPISYATHFLQGGVSAAINNSTSYVQVDTTIHKAGSVNLSHKGGFVAKFYVTWEECTFEKGEKGEVVKKRQSVAWEKNGQSLTSGFNTVIPIPGNAEKLHVTVTENTGLAWEGWRTIVNQNIPVTPNARISVWGTTLSPKSEVIV